MGRHSLPSFQKNFSILHLPSRFPTFLSLYSTESSAASRFRLSCDTVLHFPPVFSLFIASGGRIPHRPDVGLPLSPFLPHPAGTSSGQNAALRQSSLRPPPEKTDITKTGSPQAPGSFRFCPNPVIPRGEAPGIRTTARRPPPKCAPPVRAPPCAAAGSAAPSTPCAPPPPPR